MSRFSKTSGMSIQPVSAVIAYHNIRMAKKETVEKQICDLLFQQPQLAKILSLYQISIT